MKTKLFLIIIGLIASSNFAFSQFTFGVSPSLGFNSAHVGYKISDNLVPFIGFQMAKISTSNINTYTYIDFNDEKVTDVSEYEADATLFVPNIGLKYFLMQQKKLKTYISLSIAIPIVSGKVKQNGSSYNEDEILNNTSMLGGEFGFGVEYFVDDNFSIGGEFGIRYLNVNSSYEYNDIDFQETDKYEIDFNLMPTYTRVSLNYYF